MSQQLKQKIIQSGFWASCSFAASKVLQIISSIFVARILLPEDYGINGIIWSVILIMERFSQMGMQHAAVQNSKYDINNMNSVLDTLFVSNVIRGLILSVLMYLSSNWIAEFYNEPQLVVLVKFMSLYFISNSLINVGLTINMKNVDFKRLEIWQQTATSVGYLATIFLALYLRNIWALVIGGLIGNILFTLSSYFVSPYKPKMCFNSKIFFELFSFGKYFIMTEVLILLASRLDSIVIGKVKGFVELGLYVLAYRVVCLNLIQLTNVLYKITFPAFAQVQEDSELVIKVFIKSLKIFLSFVCPGLAFLFIFAPEVVHVVYGNKWMKMVPVLEIIIFVAAFKSIENLFKSIFQGTGNIKVLFNVHLICTSNFIILIYPIAKYFGINGVAFLLLSMTMLFHAISWPIFFIKYKASLKSIFDQLLLPIVSTFILSLLLFVSKKYYILFFHSELFTVTANFISGIIIYLILFISMSKIQSIYQK